MVFTISAEASYKGGMRISDHNFAPPLRHPHSAKDANVRPRKRCWIAVLALGLLTRAAQGAAPVTLDVLVLNDVGSPRVRLTKLVIVLKRTHELLGEKLGFEAFEFRLRDGGSLAQFMERNAPMDGECMRHLSEVAVGVGPGKRRARDMPLDRVTRYLQQWPLESLVQWFQGDPSPPTTYTDVARRAVAAMDERLSA